MEQTKSFEIIQALEVNEQFLAIAEKVQNYYQRNAGSLAPVFSEEVLDCFNAACNEAFEDIRETAGVVPELFEVRALALIYLKQDILLNNINERVSNWFKDNFDIFNF